MAIVNDDRFFVKTHSNGLKTHLEGIEQVNLRELVVYKLFYKLGLGPEVDFFINETNPNHLFIVTKDLGSNFKTFRQDITWENHDEDQDDEAMIKNCLQKLKRYQTQLVQMYLICKLLFLKDLINNPDNFGFLNAQSAQLKIIDFLIQDVQDINFKQDIENYSKINLSVFIQLPECIPYFILLSNPRKKCK